MDRILHYKFEKGVTKFSLKIPIGAEFLEVLRLRRRAPFLVFAGQEDADYEERHFFVVSHRGEIPRHSEYMGCYRLNRPGYRHFFVFELEEKPGDGDGDSDDGGGGDTDEVNLTGSSETGSK